LRVWLRRYARRPVRRRTAVMQMGADEFVAVGAKMRLELYREGGSVGYSAGLGRFESGRWIASDEPVVCGASSGGVVHDFSSEPLKIETLRIELKSGRQP
jgi:hypothetical protein